MLMGCIATKSYQGIGIWHKAGKFGHAAAYYNIGNAYFYGRGVERDDKKANIIWNYNRGRFTG